jgi:hypothetical protein
MPPVTIIGTAHITQILNMMFKSAKPHIFHTHHSSSATTAPTSGKKHSVYLKSSSVKPDVGIGIFENVENAAIIDFIIFIFPS